MAVGAAEQDGHRGIVLGYPCREDSLGIRARPRRGCTPADEHEWIAPGDVEGAVPLEGCLGEACRP